MKRDDLIFELIEKEHQRQLKGIELIASENFVSDQVMQAMGSCLTNKYAEGYPGKRYYGGCEVVDQSELIAIDRLKQIFGAEWANVQPHSGAQANAAVFAATRFCKKCSCDWDAHTRRSPLPRLLGQHFRYYLYSLRI